MDHDPLDVIAESYRSIAESTQTMAQTTQLLAQGQLRMEANQRSLARLTVVAALPSVLGLVLLGWLVWQTLGMQHDHAAQLQTLTLQTEALRAVLRQRPTP